MKLEALLRDRGIRFDKHTHPAAFTAQRLAQVEHVSGYVVAKPVVVKGAAGYAMCVLPAARRLDLQEVTKVLHDPTVRLATEQEMTQLFPECELGAEPPVGSLFGMKTIADRQLEEDEYLEMQAGTHYESVRFRRDDWERLCQPTVAPIARAT
ncbi:YbaK / prolyl-tRNA synthetases associated domain protein [Phycisphaerae bacterium RAS1]|nr:YbaK / prolyl-tRNA synthetases associated domain protein [Phycisphaerae bacterium RAS1]